MYSNFMPLYRFWSHIFSISWVWKWVKIVKSTEVNYGEIGVFILENMSDQNVKLIKKYFIHSYNYIPNKDLKICKKWNSSHLKIIFCWFHSLCEISGFCHRKEESFTNILGQPVDPISKNQVALISCPELLVNNYQHTLCNYLEKWRLCSLYLFTTQDFFFPT